MPRVLIVSHFFPPHGGGGVHRALAWARHLPAHGWNVTVLAAGPHGFWIEDPTLLARVPRDTEVLRVDAPTGVALWRRLARRGGEGQASARTDGAIKALARALVLPDSYRAWLGPAVRAGRARIAQGGIDALVSTSPPETAHLVGESLARASGLPWLADFRDPWVALHYRRPPTPLHAALHRRLERRVIERAARLTCASRTHADALAADLAALLGEAARARVAFLPNGIELEPPAQADPVAEVPPRRPGVARIAGTGSFVEVPALARILDALAARLAREPARAGALEVLLAGAYEEALRARAAERGLGQVVRFLGPVSHAAARALQLSADALLLVRNEGPGYEAMVPGKLYEYLDARRPLVAALGEGEAAQLAREAGARVVPPAEGAAALDALLAALDGAPGAARPDDGAITRLLAVRSRAALAGQMAQLLDALLPERSR